MSCRVYGGNAGCSSAMQRIRCERGREGGGPKSWTIGKTVCAMRVKLVGVGRGDTRLCF